MNGTIFNIQKFCVNDGPGIRTTVFVKGCPLRCAWCHNPESQAAEPELMRDPGKCRGCGRCRDVPPTDRAFVCFYGAREVCGREISPEEVVAGALRDKAFYDRSGGGLTLSGGEPFFQPAFTLEVLERAKAAGLHTVVETCGFAAPETVRRAAALTDRFLYDCKETDPERHRAFTGVDNARILENLRLLDGLGKEIVLRCPIIPGCNDRPEHFDGICRLAGELEHVLLVELSPYHALGEHKYDALGRDGGRFPAPDEAQKQAWLDAAASGCRKPVRFA